MDHPSDAHERLFAAVAGRQAAQIITGSTPWGPNFDPALESPDRLPTYEEAQFYLRTISQLMPLNRHSNCVEEHS